MLEKHLLPSWILGSELEPNSEVRTGYREVLEKLTLGQSRSFIISRWRRVSLYKKRLQKPSFFRDKNELPSLKILSKLLNFTNRPQTLAGYSFARIVAEPNQPNTDTFVVKKWPFLM